MKPDKNPFLLIPLRAIRLLLSDPDPKKETSSLTQIYYLSIYTSAMKLNISEKDAVMQYVYCGYRTPQIFTPALMSAWSELENSSYCGYDPHYRGMSGGRIDYEDQGSLIHEFCQQFDGLIEDSSQRLQPQTPSSVRREERRNRWR